MKLEYNTIETNITISQIELGECFEYNETVYIRAFLKNAFEKEYLAVSIKSGIITRFLKNIKVTPVNAKVIIDDSIFT